MTDSRNLMHKDWSTLSDDQKEIVKESMRNWRSRASWFSWGSPVGLGFWLIACGIFFVLLHMAHILG